MSNVEEKIDMLLKKIDDLYSILEKLAEEEEEDMEEVD